MGISLFYGDDLLGLTRRVNIEANNQSIDGVLKLCFSGQPVSYTIIDKTIIIKAVEYPTSVNGVVSGVLKGKITDMKGALPGVSVKLTGQGIQLTNVSDNNGNYIFANLKAGKYTLTFNFVGYDPLTKEIVLDNGESPDINIVLKEKTSQA